MINVGDFLQCPKCKSIRVSVIIEEARYYPTCTSCQYKEKHLTRVEIEEGWKYDDADL